MKGSQHLRIQVLLLLFALLHAFDWPWEDSSTSQTESGTVVTTSGFLGEKTTSRNAYQPYLTSCSDSDLVREATGISSREEEYIKARHHTTNENLRDFLSNKANLSDVDEIFDASDNRNISIGLAFSGGGYRAMLCGAGQLLALDDRFDQSEEEGLGGLLQSSTYITGLSGGSWLVGSMVLNDWISVGDIVDGSIDIWNLEDTIFNPNGINIIRTVNYYNTIRSSIEAKREAGFDTSVTDIWGRALSHQFFESEDGGVNITWSSIREMDSFMTHEMPFPIVVANGRTPDTFIVNLNSTVFEINPHELGSWDPSLRSFSDVKHLGTSVSEGSPNSSRCVVNFDNAGFILGTSSSLFNQALIRLGSSNMNAALKYVFNRILSSLSYNEDDIAAYNPNPFYKSDNGNVQSIVKNDTLFLVDGGEDLQNVPLYPLIQTSRDVDVIFAFDNSADTNQNWPNGTSLVHTYNRQFDKQGKGTPFPYVPSEKEFIDEEFNKRPVFFGCDASNLTDLIDYHDNDNITETDIPLIIYIPNARISENSNTSTYKMSYNNDEKMSLIKNGFEVATRKNLTDDEDWATCVGCAIVRRTQERNDLEQDEKCNKCFEKYCWQGVSNSPSNATNSNPSNSVNGRHTSSTSKRSRAQTATSSPSNSVLGSGATSSQTLTATDSASTPRSPWLITLIISTFLSFL